MNANQTGLLDFYRQFWRIVWGDMGSVCKKVCIGYLILVVYYLIFGKDRERKIFGVQAVILAAVCFNPFCMYYISRLADLSTRYFRFLWLLPLALTYGHFFAQLLRYIRYPKVAAAAAYILSFALLYYGATKVTSVTSRLYNSLESGREMVAVDNIYKVEADTQQISEIIEADKKDPAKAVKVLYGYDVFLDIRTYDASIYSGMTLKDQARFRNTQLRKKKMNRLYKREKYKAFLNYLVNAHAPAKEFTYNTDKIMKALRERDYEYVVVQTDKYTMPWFEACGDMIGLTDHFTVIRVFPDEQQYQKSSI
ncbi:MAG: hypothetical protein IJ860_09530 [Eubacterium sp.]|nr:hypothetical protein [Eubacterium sp.]